MSMMGIFWVAPAWSFSLALWNHRIHHEGPAQVLFSDDITKTMSNPNAEASFMAEAKPPDVLGPKKDSTSFL
jgi:hypothetical protein